MDIWDEYLAEEDHSNSIRAIIDGHGMVMFFKKDKDLYGGDEDSRMVFARMKNPDEDSTEGWDDEASFMAVNLCKLLKGEPAQHVFQKRDLKKMKIMDVEDVIEDLKNQAHESGETMAPLKVIRLSTPDGQGVNSFRTDEE